MSRSVLIVAGVVEMSITTNQKQQTEKHPPLLRPPSPQETPSGRFVAMATSR